MGEFQKYLHSVAQSKKQNTNLLYWVSVVEASQYCSTKIQQFVDNLNLNETCLLYRILNEDEAEDWLDQNDPETKKKKAYKYKAKPLGESPKEKTKTNKDYKQYGVNKQRYLSPWESEHLGDILHGNWQKYSGPRDAFMKLARKMSRENGKPVADNISKVSAKQVYDYLVQNGMNPATTKEDQASIINRYNYLKKELLNQLSGAKSREFNPQLGPAIRQVLKSQEPIIKAWRENPDADPEDILELLKSQGTSIIPDQYLKYAAIDEIKKVRDKIRNGEALTTPHEREIFKVWQDMANANPLNKNPDPTQVIAPDYVYDQLHKLGKDVVNRDAVELELIKKVKNDIDIDREYEEDPNEKPNAKGETPTDRKMQRAGERWLKDVQDALDKGVLTTNQDLPSPYVQIDYHQPKYGFDPEIRDSYYTNGVENKKYISDIVRPAVDQTIIYLKQIDPELQLMKFTPNYEDTEGYGIEQAINKSFDQEVEKYTGLSLTSIVGEVIARMLTRTGSPEWDTNSAKRNGTAHTFAKKIIEAARKENAKKFANIQQAKEKLVADTQHNIARKGTQPISNIDPAKLQQIKNNPEFYNKLKWTAINGKTEEERQAAQNILRLIDEI